MKGIVVPLCLFLLVGGLFLGLGGMGEAKPNLVVALGELKLTGYSFTINPSKYTYRHAGSEVAVTTVKNLTGEDARFDMGDSSVVTVLAYSSLEYQYRVKLKGETVRIPITRLEAQTGGIRIVERINLKIEPEKKGGDTR